MNAIVLYRVRAVTCTRRILETLLPSFPPPFSLAFIRTARRHHLALYTSLPQTSFSFLFLERKRSPAEISQILGSDIFFCVEGLEFTVRERAWTTHESVTKINIYSSARAEPMVIPERFLGENDARYRSHTAGETTCPRYTVPGYESPGKRGRVLLNTVD